MRARLTVAALLLIDVFVCAGLHQVEGAVLYVRPYGTKADSVFVPQEVCIGQVAIDPKSTAAPICCFNLRLVENDTRHEMVPPQPLGLWRLRHNTGNDAGVTIIQPLAPPPQAMNGRFQEVAALAVVISIISGLMIPGKIRTDGHPIRAFCRCLSPWVPVAKLGPSGYSKAVRVGDFSPHIQKCRPINAYGLDGLRTVTHRNFGRDDIFAGLNITDGQLRLGQVRPGRLYSRRVGDLTGWETAAVHELDVPNNPSSRFERGECPSVRR